MYTEDKKRILQQSDVLQDAKKHAMLYLLRNLVVIFVCALLCGGVGAGAMIAAFTESGGFALLIAFFVLSSLLLWSVPVVVAVLLTRSTASSIALLRGKFVFEIDHARFSTPKSYASRTGGDPITVYVTHFEKYGTFELGKPPAMGRAFYVLATTTKKPRIIAVYDTEKFEIA
jgi:hypothetical protein